MTVGRRLVRVGASGATPVPPAAARPGLGEVLAAVAAALRSGRTLADAWRSAGVRAVDGVPAEADLARLADARPEHVAAVRAVCRLTGETGSPAAGVVDRLLTAVSADVAAARARDAALAGPRATARLLAWLPVAGVGLGASMGADPLAVALDGGWGSGGVLAGLLLTLVGRAWSRRLVGRAAGAGGEP